MFSRIASSITAELAYKAELRSNVRWRHNVRTHRSGEQEEDYTTNITQAATHREGEIELYIELEDEIRTSKVYLAGNALEV